MKTRGHVFEEAFRASCPTEVLCLKLHTPAPPANQGKELLGLLQRLAAQAGEEVPRWAPYFLSRSEHTPPQPFDFLLDAPCAYNREVAMVSHQGASFGYVMQPKLVFCLEFKVATGKSLPFSQLKEHQEKRLLEARAGFRIAGVMVEFPDNDREACYFIPIENWRAHRLEANRKSLSLSMAQLMGVPLYRDWVRGRTKVYYKVGEFLRRFGADIQEEKRDGVPRR